MTTPLDSSPPVLVADNPTEILNITVRGLWKKQNKQPPTPEMPMRDFLAQARESREFTQAIQLTFFTLFQADRMAWDTGADDEDKWRLAKEYFLERDAIYDRAYKRLTDTNLEPQAFHNELNNDSRDLLYDTRFLSAAINLCSGFCLIKLGDSHGLIEVRNAWKIAWEIDKKLQLPWAPIVEKWVNDDSYFRPYTHASAEHINGTIAIPHTVSEINRTRWVDQGDIDSITVDGVPLANRIKELPPPDNNRTRKTYRPRRAGHQRMQGILFHSERSPSPKPIPLVAYEDFGADLRSPQAADTAFMLKVVYASNQPLRLMPHEGAQLLARDRNGKFRRVQQTDIVRFNAVYMNLRGMYIWLPGADKWNTPTPYDVVDARRRDAETGEVFIAAPEWWNRLSGNWTLTGGLNVHRLAGNVENRLQRYIDGVEFWLARSQFPNKGAHQGIASALIPADNKNTGPGTWLKLDWREFLILGGDSWDFNDKRADKAARKRWERLKDLLDTHGYTVKGKTPVSRSGDTIEFEIGYGVILVRATDRFTEAARKARNKQWDTMKLGDVFSQNA